MSNVFKKVLKIVDKVTGAELVRDVVGDVVDMATGKDAKREAEAAAKKAQADVEQQKLIAQQERDNLSKKLLEDKKKQAEREALSFNLIKAERARTKSLLDSYFSDAPSNTLLNKYV